MSNFYSKRQAHEGDYRKYVTGDNFKAWWRDILATELSAIIFEHFNNAKYHKTKLKITFHPARMKIKKNRSFKIDKYYVRKRMYVVEMLQVLQY